MNKNDIQKKLNEAKGELEYIRRELPIMDAEEKELKVDERKMQAESNPDQKKLDEIGAQLIRSSDLQDTEMNEKESLQHNLDIAHAEQRNINRRSAKLDTKSLRLRETKIFAVQNFEDEPVQCAAKLKEVAEQLDDVERQRLQLDQEEQRLWKYIDGLREKLAALLENE
ncbi:hypothetical protein F53441_4596 [Fusarium austroafricanum]|uniref:Uncharacterized protein n=1 Tax=Fusarium austroafricanum TaxID=2364996 RepID=A0A8H4KLM7_9HYPO|nr:hypothetical protein F53441_4596 [Fusarium austroafricanum]